jgi:hypothetical protein
MLPAIFAPHPGVELPLINNYELPNIFKNSNRKRMDKLLIKHAVECTSFA